MCGKSVSMHDLKTIYCRFSGGDCICRLSAFLCAIHSIPLFPYIQLPNLYCHIYICQADKFVRQSHPMDSFIAIRQNNRLRLSLSFKSHRNSSVQNSDFNRLFCTHFSSSIRLNVYVSVPGSGWL